MSSQQRRVLGYIRVSSVKQEAGTSPAAQREEIERYCRDAHLPNPILFIETESAAAGKEEDRVEQLRLMREAQPGDLVLVAKQDRWSRFTEHFLSSTREIVGRGASFMSLQERYDPSTPEGVFASTVMAAVAQQEHSRIMQRLLGGRAWRRANGEHVEGLAPLGYRIEHKRLVIDPDAAPIIRRMFELCISGQTARQIARTLPHPVSSHDHTAIIRRLRSRVYLGESNTIGARGHKPKRGEWIKTHEAIVDQATWQRAQHALDDRRVGGRPASGVAKSAGFLCRGLMCCAKCGRRVTAWAPERGASITHGGYYHCLGHVRARYKDVDAEVDAQTATRVEALYTRLSKPVVVPTKRDRTAERARLVRRKANLVEAIADGTLTKEDARAKLAEIAARIAEIDAPEPVVDRAAAFRQVAEVREAWSAATVAEKRGIVRTLADRIELRGTAVRKWQRSAWEIVITWREID